MENLFTSPDIFPPSSIIVACDDIIGHLRTLRYANGRPVFASPETQVTYGLGWDLRDGFAAEDTPIIRLWSDSIDVQMESAHFYAKEIYPASISLYVYCYAPGEEREGDGIQQYRQRLCEHILRYLQKPESGVTGDGGLMPREGSPGTNTYIWSWVEDQIVTIDHTSTFKRVNDAIIMVHPYYASRIDLQIRGRNNIAETLTP